MKSWSKFERAAKVSSLYFMTKRFVKLLIRNWLLVIRGLVERVI